MARWHFAPAQPGHTISGLLPGGEPLRAGDIVDLGFEPDARLVRAGLRPYTEEDAQPEPEQPTAPAAAEPERPAEPAAPAPPVEAWRDLHWRARLALANRIAEARGDELIGGAGAGDRAADYLETLAPELVAEHMEADGQ